MSLGENEDRTAAIAAENAELERATNDGIETIEDRAAPQQQRPETDAGEPEQPRELVRGSKFDSKRSSIYEAAKAKRAADQEKIDEAVRDINDRLEERQPPVSDEPRRHKLKVHDQEVELTDDEVKAHAQQSLAAGNILEKAKREREQLQNERAEAASILETLRRERATTPASGAGTRTSEQRPQPTIAAGDPPPNQADDDPDLDEIVRRVQLGEHQEGVEAFQKYGDRLIEQLEARIGNLDERIVETMQTVQENTARQTATREVLESFAKDNPEFRSARLQPALATASLEIMEENMRKAGMSDEALNGFISSRRLTRAEGIGAAYRHLLEMDGNKFNLPGHANVLNDAAEVIRKDLNLPPRRQAPAPAATVDASARQERKERIAFQPRRANAPLQGDRRELTREERQLAAVRQMKQSRGRRLG